MKGKSQRGINPANDNFYYMYYGLTNLSQRYYLNSIFPNMNNLDNIYPYPNTMQNISYNSGENGVRFNYSSNQMRIQMLQMKKELKNLKLEQKIMSDNYKQIFENLQLEGKMMSDNFELERKKMSDNFELERKKMSDNFKQKIANLQLEQKIMSDNFKQKIANLQLEQKLMSDNLEQKIKNFQLEKEGEIKELNSQISSLRVFDEKINKSVEEIKLYIKGLKINETTDDESIKKEIQSLNTKLKLFEDELLNLKRFINEKNNVNIEKISSLENEIKALKSKIKELQSLLIGRKIIKILLRIIIENCFVAYKIEKNAINFAQFKAEKYIPYKNIANNLIKILYGKNGIIHINDEINEIIDIINYESTYGDILLVIKNFLKKNDYDNIKDLLEEKLLFNKKCNVELIGPDEELSNILKVKNNL